MADGTHQCCGQSWIDGCACPPPSQGEPANPYAFPVSTIDGFTQEGMTLRDWFAGQALAGLLASRKWDNCGAGFEGYISVHAGNIADAMLAAREQKQ